jgi:hypothetical protein
MTARAYSKVTVLTAAIKQPAATRASTHTANKKRL